MCFTLLINLVHFLINMFKKNKKIIAIEGNIGVGKTTLLNYLKKNKKFSKNAEFVDEPVEQWQSIVDNENKNILGRFYENKLRWGFMFQHIIYETRLRAIMDIIMNSKKSIVFLDRSLGTDKNVFENMLYDDNLISKLEHEIYGYWDTFYEKYLTNNKKKNIIYLHCSPIVAFNRIQQRGRIEEKTIDMNYLIKLHNRHEQWINKEIQNHNNVLIIDCEQNINLKQTCQQIDKFITNCN